MPLIKQSFWWIIPFVGLALLIGVTTMSLALTFLARRPQEHRQPVPAAELRQRLLALNAPGQPYHLVEAGDGGTELHWKVVDTSWAAPFGRIKTTTVYRARLWLDEARHEARWYESLRTANLFLGLEGWRPRFNASLTFMAGYVDGDWAGRAYGILPGFPPRIGDVAEFTCDTVAVRQTIIRTVTGAGWTFQPVVWRIQVDSRWNQLAGALLPVAVRSWSARRSWSALAAGSYAATVAYSALAFGLDAFLLVWWTIFSLVWWGIWGFVVWVLGGFPGARTRWVRRRNGT